MGHTASVPEYLTLEDARRLVPAERWVAEWDERFGEPKGISKRTAQGVWAKAERAAQRFEAPPAHCLLAAAQAKEEHGDEETLRVSGRAETFFAMVVGFLRSKWTLDAAAEAEMPKGFAVESFADADVAQNGDSEDAVYAAAAEAAADFEEIVRKAGAGLPPTAVDVAPFKGRARAREKVATDYRGDWRCLCDVVRASVVAGTEAEVLAVARELRFNARPRGRGEAPWYEVVRCKNRFASPPFNGYRDALYSIRLRGGHVCEVQLHLAAIVELKKETHVFYEFFRSYFGGCLETVRPQRPPADTFLFQ